MYSLYSYTVQAIYCNISFDCRFFWTETTVSGAEDSIETNETAAALLNMESPNNILDEKRMSEFVFHLKSKKIKSNLARVLPRLMVCPISLSVL